MHPCLWVLHCDQISPPVIYGSFVFLPYPGTQDFINHSTQTLLHPTIPNLARPEVLAQSIPLRPWTRRAVQGFAWMRRISCAESKVTVRSVSGRARKACRHSQHKGSMLGPPVPLISSVVSCTFSSGHRRITRRCCNRRGRSVWPLKRSSKSPDPYRESNEGQPASGI